MGLFPVFEYLAWVTCKIGQSPTYSIATAEPWIPQAQREKENLLVLAEKIHSASLEVTRDRTGSI